MSTLPLFLSSSVFSLDTVCRPSSLGWPWRCSLRNHVRNWSGACWDQCLQGRELPVKPERVDGPLWVLMSKGKCGLVYVTKACVPKKECESDFCECLRYTSSLIYKTVPSVYYIKELCVNLFSSTIIALQCNFLAKKSVFWGSHTACIFYIRDHRRTSNVVNLMYFRF